VGVENIFLLGFFGFVIMWFFGFVFMCIVVEWLQSDGGIKKCKSEEDQDV